MVPYCRLTQDNSWRGVCTTRAVHNVLACTACVEQYVSYMSGYYVTYVINIRTERDACEAEIQKISLTLASSALFVFVTLSRCRLSQHRQHRETFPLPLLQPTSRKHRARHYLMPIKTPMRRKRAAPKRIHQKASERLAMQGWMLE